MLKSSAELKGKEEGNQKHTGWMENVPRQNTETWVRRQWVHTESDKTQTPADFSIRSYEVLFYLSDTRTTGGSGKKTQNPFVRKFGSCSTFNASQRDIIQKNAALTKRKGGNIYQSTLKGYS